MKQSHLALLGIAAGIGLKTMFPMVGQVLTGLAEHQAMLQTLGNLFLAVSNFILALAYLRHGWPGK